MHSIFEVEQSSINTYFALQYESLHTLMYLYKLHTAGKRIDDVYYHFGSILGYGNFDMI